MGASNTQARFDSRKEFEIRSLRIFTNTNPFAEGSAEVVIGATRLLITASIDVHKPSEESRIGQTGGIDAAFQMLPRATHIRVQNQVIREALQHELKNMQDLIVRSLRAAVSEEVLKNIRVTLDCTIVCSDGGIATAALAGCWVALSRALLWASEKGIIKNGSPLTPVTALSGGRLGDAWCLDLCAEEASRADSIVTIVFDHHGKVIDLKATRETEGISIEDLTELLEKAREQANTLFTEQRRALHGS